MNLREFDNKAVGEIRRLMAKNELVLTNLSMYIEVHPIRISEILNGKRSVTPDTDLRLCKFFKLKDGHFLKLQNEYDLNLAREKISDRIDNIKTIDEIIR